ncbi:MAG TPA: DUF411 domain-containing protein [Longimicrobiales bacterium]|nr:DUF411 domain-containing protein [Longimicrobiales bacterium]
MNIRRAWTTVPVALLLAACGPSDASEAPAGEARPTPVASARTDAPLPAIVVYKTASCGCCNGWVEHLRAAGFEVDARDVTDLMSIKRDAGVPVDMSSCHTALVDGYVVEGHVPADVVMRLLDERPEVAGIAAPGMPVGSPGMEGPGARPYSVQSVDRQGGREVFAEVDPR